MSNLAPWPSFSRHISSNTEGPSISSWSGKERKGLLPVKTTEVTKVSNPKKLNWEPSKKKIGWRGVKEKKDPDIDHVLEKMDYNQGKSLAASHKKESNQLIKTKQSLETLKHLQEYRIMQEEKKLRKLLLKPSRENQLESFSHVPFLVRNSLKQPKLSSDESFTIPDSGFPSTLKEANKKLVGDLDGPEVVMSTTPRLSIISRRTLLDTNANQFMQDSFTSSRKGMNTKVTDTPSSFQAYDRKIKGVNEKTPYVKPDTVTTMLKPQEVLSCRYLRLSKNNIQTLMRLCKEAGMEIDIHPHMNESDMDANRIFNRKPRIAL